MLLAGDSGYRACLACYQHRTRNPLASRRLTLADGLSPVGDLGRTHRPTRLHPRIAVAPLEHVDEILLARDQRAAADALVFRRILGFLLEPRHERVRDPSRRRRLLAWVDESV